MRSMVAALALLGLSVALSACSVGGKDEYVYCDSTGCYVCTSQGCTGTVETTPNDLGYAQSCGWDGDCSGGSYCQYGTCVASASCTMTTDCALGLYCDNRNTCSPGPGFCDVAEDCTRGYYCEEGQCQASSPCTQPSDCGLDGNLVCNLGTCEPVGDVCTTSLDCPDNESCVNGLCTLNNDGNGCSCDAQCGLGGKCVNALCQIACAEGGGCGTGDTCDPGSSTCTPISSVDPTSAGSGSVCVHNVDCPLEGSVCDNGYCLTPCAGPSDCTSPGDLCVNGNCQPNTAPQASAQDACTPGSQPSQNDCDGGDSQNPPVQ